jgi:hypothetical protein
MCSKQHNQILIIQFNRLDHLGRKKKVYFRINVLMISKIILNWNLITIKDFLANANMKYGNGIVIPKILRY